LEIKEWAKEVNITVNSTDENNYTIINSTITTTNTIVKSMAGRFFGRWFYDMFFFVIICLLLRNMINGVIVTAFSAIREDSEKNLKDMENKCFICSLNKMEFEKNNISFRDHIKYEHNVNNYIYHILEYFKLSYSELDYYQYSIYRLIKNKGPEIFPIGMALSLGDNYKGNIKDEDDD